MRYRLRKPKSHLGLTSSAVGLVDGVDGYATGATQVVRFSPGEQAVDLTGATSPSFSGSARVASLDGVSAAYCDGQAGSYVDLGQPFGDGGSVVVALWVWLPPIATDAIAFWSRGWDGSGGWSAFLYLQEAKRAADGAWYELSQHAVCGGTQSNNATNVNARPGWNHIAGAFRLNTDMALFFNGVRVATSGLSGGAFRGSATGCRLGWANGTSQGPGGFAHVTTGGVPIDGSRLEDYVRRIYFATSEPIEPLPLPMRLLTTVVPVAAGDVTPALFGAAGVAVSASPAVEASPSAELPATSSVAAARAVELAAAAVDLAASLAVGSVPAGELGVAICFGLKTARGVRVLSFRFGSPAAVYNYGEPVPRFYFGGDDGES